MENRFVEFNNRTFTKKRFYGKSDFARFKIISNFVGSGNKLPCSKSSTLSAQTEGLTRYSGTSPEKFDSLSHSSGKCAGRYSASRNKLLDIGCFTGVLGEILLKHGNEVHGIDISKKALKEAAKKGIKVKLGDVEERFPFVNDFFDVVVAGEIIEHIRDTDYFLEEIKRILKRGGFLVVSTPNLVSLGRRLSYFLGRDGFHEGSYSVPSTAGGHLHYYNIGLLKLLLEFHGFEIEDFTSEVINFVPGDKVQSSFLAKIFPTLGRSLIVKAIKL